MSFGCWIDKKAAGSFVRASSGAALTSGFGREDHTICAAKDWAKADVMRGQLAEKGWVMKDGKEGYELSPV